MADIVVVNSNDEEPRNFSKGYLTLPFEGDQFKNFITSLLGKPQSIVKKIAGLFEIHLKDVQNFFELINQRVVQQNNGQLIQFLANIHFNDNSSVQLGSYEELLTYNEVKPIISRSIRLTWVYLIQFSDKSFPEKQTIELVISVARRDYDDDEFYLNKAYGAGMFTIRIDHTARSWGFDMENVILTQIHSLLKQGNRFKVFMNRYSNNISNIISLTLFSVCLIGSFLTANSFINRELAKVKFITNKSINEKINFLTTYIASGTAAKFYFYVVLFLIVSAIGSIAIGIWFNKEADKSYESSFLILTRKSKERRDEVTKRLNNNWILLLISLIGSLASGVISNYIFKILVE